MTLIRERRPALPSLFPPASHAGGPSLPQGEPVNGKDVIPVPLTAIVPPCAPGSGHVNMAFFRLSRYAAGKGDGMR